MAERLPYYIFKETQVHSESSYSDSTVLIRLPTHSSSAQDGRRSNQQFQPDKLSFTEDETAFSEKFLASASSIHTRHDKYPRSVLWRVLDGGKTLSLRAVDLNKLKGISKKLESWTELGLTLKFTFPNPIRPAGIAFADVEGQAYLNVFILTTSNDLYTLSLRDSLFYDSAGSEGNASDCYKTFLPSAFTIRYPHRLAAASAYDLLISLHDGGLLRLTREHGGDGSFWRESVLTEGGWKSSLRGYLTWQGQNSIRYGNMNLARSTATSIAFSPDNTYLFTVNLDHTIKAWNLEKGLVDCSKDLLDEDRKPEETASFQIDPSQTSLMAVLGESCSDGDLYYLVTFSPIGPGQFKFWAVKQSPNDQVYMEDMFPDTVFEPKAPSSEIWTIAQFNVTATANAQSKVMTILWKNNTSYQVHRQDIDILEAPRSWNRAWYAAATERLKDVPLPAPSEFQPADSTEQWLEYLFYPGRFTMPTLETALAVYEHSVSRRARSSASHNKTLRERMCSSIGSTVTLSRNTDGAMDYHRYHLDIDLQWRRLYRAAKDLPKQSGEALSIAIDVSEGLTWVVSSGGVSAIRNCSDLELILHNRPESFHQKDFQKMCELNHMLRSTEVDPVSVHALLRAASTFEENFPDPLKHFSVAITDSELFQDQASSVTDRITSFYDRCNFVDQISDDDYNQLKLNLKPLGGFEGLSTILFDATLEIILQGPKKGRDGLLTEFGATVLTRVAQETIELNRSVIQSLLVLVIFVTIDSACEEELVDHFDAEQIYLTLLSSLKGHEVLYWLSRRSILNRPTKEIGSAEAGPRKLSATSSLSERSREVSLLHLLIVELSSLPRAQIKYPHASLITQYSHHLLIQTGLFDAEEYEAKVGAILCNLLRCGELELATSFSKFLPSSEFSAYLRGRLDLSRNHNSIAALHFKRAALGLAQSTPKYVTLETTDHLLDLEETQLFHHGQARYFKHIADLYRKHRDYSFAADFAAIALQYVNSSLENETSNFRSGLLADLFSSSIRSSRYDTAYSTLCQYSDKQLQQNGARRLVTTICDSGNSSLLLTFPFTGQQPEIDAALVEKCQNTMNLYTGAPYHKILYAWRLKHGDFRGAASILYDRLQRLQMASTVSNDTQNSAVTQAYLALINILSTLGEGQAWILAEKKRDQSSLKRAGVSPGSTDSKRKIVTLDDIRKEYQAELDSIALVENGQFSYTDGDVMEGVEAL